MWCEMMRECCRKQNINWSDSRSLIMNLRNLLWSTRSMLGWVTGFPSNRNSARHEVILLEIAVEQRGYVGCVTLLARSSCWLSCSTHWSVDLSGSHAAVDSEFIPCYSIWVSILLLLQRIQLWNAFGFIASVCGKQHSRLCRWTLSRQRDINEITIWLWFERICHRSYVFGKLKWGCGREVDWRANNSKKSRRSR